jgi:hypothetical protein
MSRTLTRPMFRLGGSTSSGITSGLDKPKRGRVDEPGRYSYTLPQVLPTREEMKFTEEILGPRGPDRSVSDFLINYGLNLAGNPPSGNIIQTAAKEAQAPFQKFQAQRGMREQSGRQEKADILGAIMGAKAEMLGGEGTGSMYHTQVKAAESKRLLNDLFTLAANQKDPAKKLGDEAYKKAKSLLMIELQSYRGANAAVDSLFKSGTQADLVIGGIQSDLTSSTETITIINDEGEEEEVIEGEYYQANPSALGRRTQEVWLQRYKEAQEQSLGLGGAEGGRVGYQAGNLVDEQLTEVEETPQGIRALSENIEEEGPASSELSFEELRGRLPPEVTDDIINLIVQSPSALVDFAEVQTQTDVDNFNAKYGVNLVLPSEA